MKRFHSSRVTTYVVPSFAFLVVLSVFVANVPACHGISLHADEQGALVYTANDLGDRIPDFSHAGYGGGGVPIPHVPAQVRVSPSGDDDTVRIQAALDKVSALPVDRHGFRGAVLLDRGTFSIGSSLRISASGVVLRGSGQGEDGTILAATGTSRRTLIDIRGNGDRSDIPGSLKPIITDYVPVGATVIPLENTDGLTAGDRIVIRRPSTIEWIDALGMNTFPGWRPENRLHWRKGSRDIEWDRVITDVSPTAVTIDAPLTTALDRKYGESHLVRYRFPGRIEHVGVENLRCVSQYDRGRPYDEDHSWFCISLDKLENGWILQVTALHFASYVINAERDTKWLTIEDCTALEPVSELGGYRRRVFYTAGQLALFLRCASTGGRRDFITGFATAGPNVFLDCTSHEAYDYSGPLESWASGVLYDNVIVRGNGLRLIDRGDAGQGTGWAAANCVLWNCEATDIEACNPPYAFNRAFGCRGEITGDGIVLDERAMPFRDFFRGMKVEPLSLYRAQLSERMGEDTLEALERISPIPEPVTVEYISEIDVAANASLQSGSRNTQPLRVEDGYFMIGNDRVWSRHTGYSWYQAQMPRSLAGDFGHAITRFAPGRRGTGLTDDLDVVTADLAPGTAFYQHYGLWYDRRRINHDYFGSSERRTGDVWAPFMELPWARSGIGKAWDGLSKFDLGRFNPWYFDRVRGFADRCDTHGLILYYQFYFQHWLLESRAHYVDFPWSPANCIQETGMPVERPATREFYDVDHPVRRALHRAYIRKCLDTMKHNTNIVYGIDPEYTGPLAFVEFVLDTMSEWAAENRTIPKVCLRVPKAEMDALLDDPARRQLIAAVIFHWWKYRPDGELFAIRGGIERAPRQQQGDIVTPDDILALRKSVTAGEYRGENIVNSPEYRQLGATLWESTPEMKYRAYREYRDRYPELVIIDEENLFPAVSAAVDTHIPHAVRSSTSPASLVPTSRETCWCMADPEKNYIVYTMQGKPVELDLASDGNTYRLMWVDSGDGSISGGGTISGGRTVTLEPPQMKTGRPWVAWLKQDR
jgi:hypothetical protein